MFNSLGQGTKYAVHCVVPENIHTPPPPTPAQGNGKTEGRGLCASVVLAQVVQKLDNAIISIA